MTTTKTPKKPKTKTIAMPDAKPESAPKKKRNKKDIAKAILTTTDPVEVFELDDLPEETPEPKKDKPAEKPKRVHPELGIPLPDAKPESAPASTERPGIIACILENLMKATEDKPITKAEMFDIVKAKFPDRPPSSLNVTVHAQMVPARQWADRRIKLGVKALGAGTAKGYWLPKEETLEKGRERKAAEKKSA